MAITLTVTHPNGGVEIQTEPDWSIGYLKLKAVEKTPKLDMVSGMVLHDLVKSGEVLKLKSKVSECGLVDGDTLLLERKHGTVVNI